MIEEDEIMNKIFFEKYKVIKKLGQGSFGQVFLGSNIKNEDSIALKFVKNKFI
jgi:serine/threonine protein kinase